MPAQKTAATRACTDRGMTPSGVATETGETSCRLSPTFSFSRSARRRPITTEKSLPKSFSDAPVDRLVVLGAAQAAIAVAQLGGPLDRGRERRRAP